MANFIKNAIKRPGALTDKAKKAGKSTLQYAQEAQHGGDSEGAQEARFYLNVLKKARPGSKK